MSNKTSRAVEAHFDRIIERLHFSTRYRKSQEKKMLKSLAVAKRSWEHMGEMDETERDIIRTLTEFCTMMIGKIHAAEDWSRGLVLRDKRVRIYRHIFRKNEYLMLFDFFKVSEGMRKQGSIICNSGLPNSKKKPALFFRNGFATKSYELVDAGTFTQKVLSFSQAIYNLKCKNYNVRFLLVCKNEDEKTCTIVKIARDQV